MKDLPPPPEPAFANWCAKQIAPPHLCEQLHPTTPDAAGYSFEVWALLFVIALLVGGLIGYQVWFSRRAYLGGRFCEALGGYKKAAEHLEDIEAVNEARIYAGIHAHAKFKYTRPRK